MNIALQEIYMNIKKLGKRYGYNSGHAICARCRQYPKCLDPRRLPDPADQINCPWENARKGDSNA
jgi:hypothetical protein